MSIKIKTPKIPTTTTDTPSAQEMARFIADGDKRPTKVERVYQERIGLTLCSLT